MSGRRGGLEAPEHCGTIEKTEREIPGPSCVRDARRRAPGGSTTMYDRATMSAVRRTVRESRTAGRRTPNAATTARMKAIRQRGTEPELRVRRLLSCAGLHYRICPADLPGRPDLANKSMRWALFVHGCFWHAHPNCRLATVPKTNRAFWVEKLTANRARDATKAQALRKLGYKVVTVWQCELDDPRLPQTLPRRLLSGWTRRRS